MHVYTYMYTSIHACPGVLASCPGMKPRPSNLLRKLDPYANHSQTIRNHAKTCKTHKKSQTTRNVCFLTY